MKTVCFQTTFTPIWSVLKVQGASPLTCALCSLSFAQKYPEARRLPAAAPEARWPAAGIWSPEARWSWGRWLAVCDSLPMRQEIRRGCSAGLLSRCQRGIWTLRGAEVTGTLFWVRLCSWGACSHLRGNRSWTSPLRSLECDSWGLFFWEHKFMFFSF